MAEKRKRLTQRQKNERAQIRRKLQAEGLIPPNKPRLDRKKFAAAVIPEFEAMDVCTADFYLRKAIYSTVAADMRSVTVEQVGVLKLLKLAVETSKFMDKLKTEGREKYSVKEYYDEVLGPIERL